MGTLRVIEGPDKGVSFPLTAETSVIGRTSEQIPLSDGNASRKHAQIEAVDGLWVLKDLGSSNGTFLNGDRITVPTPISPGDHIRVGSTILIFGDQGQGAPREKAVPDEDTRLSVEESLLDGSAIVASVDASNDSEEFLPRQASVAVAGWKLIYAMGDIFGTADSEEVLLDRVADITFDHITADRLVLLTREGGAGKLIPRAVRRRPSDGTEETIPAVSRTVIQHVLKTVDGVLCRNAMMDDRFGYNSPQDSMVRLGPRSILCAPITSRGEVFGVLHLDCSAERHTYTSEQLRLLVAIGRLTGMAMENVTLINSRVQTERLAAVGETAAYLSHHIRNILQGLQTGTDAVEQGLEHDDVAITRSGWRLMRRNLDRILQLASNLLTFSKSRQPRATETQVNAVIEDVISMSQGKAAEKEVSLITDLHELPAVTLDPEGMLQAVYNLVLNAIDAVPTQTGRVIVTTQFNKKSKQILLTVTDNGSGIPESSRGRIFDPFHSGKGLSGTGLGLAAAHKIVRELGGTIRLESGEDVGTSFHIELPCEPAHSTLQG